MKVSYRKVRPGCRATASPLKTSFGICVCPIKHSIRIFLLRIKPKVQQSLFHSLLMPVQHQYASASERNQPFIFVNRAYIAVAAHRVYPCPAAKTCCISVEISKMNYCVYLCLQLQTLLLFLLCYHGCRLLSEVFSFLSPDFLIVLFNLRLLFLRIYSDICSVQTGKRICL